MVVVVVVVVLIVVMVSVVVLVLVLVLSCQPPPAEIKLAALTEIGTLDYPLVLECTLVLLFRVLGRAFAVCRVLASLRVALHPVLAYIFWRGAPRTSSSVVFRFEPACHSTCRTYACSSSVSWTE